MPTRVALAIAVGLALLLPPAASPAGMSAVRAAARSSRTTRPASRAVLAVGNSYDGTVDLIDARTLRRLGPPLNVIPDGSTPRDRTQAALYPAILARRGEPNDTQEVAFSPDGRTLYVSRGYLGDVAAFSLATHRLLWRLEVPALRADHLAVSPDGRRLFASALPGTKVYAIDTRTHRYAGSYAAGDFPHVLEFSPDGRLLYSGSLGNQLAPYGQDHGTHLLTAVDPRTLVVKRTYRFAAGVRPFAFATRDRLVLQLSYFAGFDVLDLASGRVRAVALPVRGSGRALLPSQYPNAAAAHGIAVSGDTVCAAGTVSNYVAMVSLSGRLRRLETVGRAPGEALTGPGGRYCFVISRGPTGLHVPHVSNGDDVSVISYRTGRLVRRIPVGRHPQAEALATVPEQTLRAGGFTR